MKTLVNLSMRSLFTAIGMAAFVFASSANAQMSRSFVFPPVGNEIRSLPYTISQPGLYYIRKNLTGVDGANGITVEASQVTIEFNGYSLVGTPTSMHGIAAAAGTRDLVVRNGTIKDWGVDGINTSAASHTTLEDMKLLSNLASGFRGDERSTARRSTASGNGDAGFWLEDHCLLEDCLANNNGFWGVAIDDYFVLRGVRCSMNGFDGVDCQNHGTVADSVFSGNGHQGFSGGESATCQRCIAEGNSFSGFEGSSSSVWSHCTAKDNGYEGFLSFENGRIICCTSVGNRIGFLTGPGAIVEDCVAADNTEHGIRIGQGTVARNNSCRANGMAGIHVDVGTQRARVEGNHLVNNDKGIEVLSGATDNMIFGNSACANVIANYDIAPGNDDAPLATVKTATSYWVNLSL